MGCFLNRRYIFSFVAIFLVILSRSTYAGFSDRTSELIPGLTGNEPAKAAWGDYNNDGYPDLLAGKVLYRNDFGNGFTAVASNLAAGIWGDYDNDGYLDLFLYTQRVIKRNIDGSGSFETIIVPKESNAARSAAWIDINNDGWLDLYIPGAVSWNPDRCYKDYILINMQGEGFDKYTQPNYIDASASCQRSRGIATADFDRDGDQDIYLSNYGLEPNTLWENISAVSSQWEDSGRKYNVDDGGHNGADPNIRSQWKLSGGHTIGSSWGDFDNDGWLDLLVGHFAHSWNPKALILKNNGVDKQFTLKKRFTGSFYQESYANPTLGDFDNDGLLDFFFTTVYAGDSARLYRNTGNFQFTNVTSTNNLGGVKKTYQAAWADFDNDGDLDLVSGGKLFVNNENNGNHWIKVQLQGDTYDVNRYAIGAQVRVYSGNKVLTRQVEGGTGEGNQNDLVLHFGLGVDSTPVTIDVLWPDGSVEMFANISVNQKVSLPEGNGLPNESPNIASWLIPILHILL